MSMNKSIPKKDQQEETIESIKAKYASTAKRVGINILEVKPNNVIAKIVRHIKPIAGHDGKELILPSSVQVGDELVFEVIMRGKLTLDSVMMPYVGDKIVVRNGYPIRFQPSTKLTVGDIEDAVFHMIPCDDILYTVDYVKID